MKVHRFVVTLALLFAPIPAGGACPDPSAVLTLHAAAEAECRCATATNHGQYVKCVAGVAKGAAGSTLPKQCKDDVIRCAAQSTCGKPGSVTCCRTTIRRGVPVTRCSVKRDAAHCVAPSGGSACAGNFPSCCDACTSNGCRPTTTTTTTTTLPPCGSATDTTCTGSCPSGQICASLQDIRPSGPFTYCGGCITPPVCSGIEPVVPCGGNCQPGRSCTPFRGIPTPTTATCLCR
jgi:hypothetical protein